MFIWKHNQRRCNPNAALETTSRVLATNKCLRAPEIADPGPWRRQFYQQHRAG